MKDDEIIYKDYEISGVTIKNVPYKKNVNWVITPGTFYSLNKLLKEKYSEARQKNKVIEYEGNDEK